MMKNRLHTKSGEPIEEPIHPGQQRRIQQRQEVFSEDCFSSARVDQHTGMGILAFIYKFLVVVRIRMELEVSSQFYYFAQISHFCYSWFRLQSIAIHCNRRGVYTYTPHTRHFHPCAHITLWLKVSYDVSASSTCHHMSERLLFPSFVFFLCLSCLYFLSHFYLPSVLNFHPHVVENAEH